MSPKKLEEIVSKVEAYFVKYGAKPAEDLDVSKIALFGQRIPFIYGKEYYRAEAAVLDERDYILISTIDDEKLANVSMMDDIAAFPADYPEEKIEKEVRFALGIEPYPANYPDY